jgi:hypothetical protein
MGKPIDSRKKIPSGQAPIESLQGWQRPLVRVSGLDQGGRIERPAPLWSPRRNWAFLLALFTVHLEWASSVSSVPVSGFDIDQGSTG